MGAESERAAREDEMEGGSVEQTSGSGAAWAEGAGAEETDAVMASCSAVFDGAAEAELCGVTDAGIRVEVGTVSVI